MDLPITNRVLRAKKFAIEAHGNQQYGKGLPYEYHLQKVHDELVRVGVEDKELLMSAWLHDTVEDTPTTVQDVEWVAGWRVASIVWAVSDGPGINRKERKLGAYAKIRIIPDAATVKLADRIANFRASIGSAEKRDDPRMMSMYLKESEGFYQGLTGSRFSSPKQASWARLLTSTLQRLEQEAQQLLDIDAEKRKENTSRLF